MLDLTAAKWYEKMDGKSLLPIFHDQNTSVRKSFLGEYFVEKVATKVPAWQAVRTEQWKYIHYPALRHMDELYNLSSDPRELQNLYNDPAFSNRLDEMQTELGRLLHESGGK